MSTGFYGIMASLVDIGNVADEINIGASKTSGLGYNMSNWNKKTANLTPLLPPNTINIGNDNSIINLYGKVYIVNSTIDQFDHGVRRRPLN